MEAPCVIVELALRTIQKRPMGRAFRMVWKNVWNKKLKVLLIKVEKLFA